MADGMVLATEERPAPDAIVTIATLTGAAMRTFGDEMAAVLGTNQPLVEQVLARRASTTDEPLWQLPLNKRYRKWLGLRDRRPAQHGRGERRHDHGRAVPGRVRRLDALRPPGHRRDDDGRRRQDWSPRGATAYGTRLLIDLAQRFTPPD